MKRSLLFVSKINPIFLCAFIILLNSVQLFGAKFYVNDNLTGTEFFCSVTGNNAFSGLLPSEPKRLLGKIWILTGGNFASRDRIFADSGNYTKRGADALTNESKFGTTSSSGLVIIGAEIGVTVFDNNFYGTNPDYFLWTKASNVTLKNFNVTNHECGAPNSGGTYATVNNN